jgi:hypothetical protein
MNPRASDSSNREMEIAELRGKLIEQEINVLKAEDDKKSLTQKWYDMK